MISGLPRHWLILAETEVPMTATGKPDVLPAQVRATGAPATSTIDEARETAGPDQPVLGSAIAGGRS